ncbi:MAG: hypothetical protein ACLU8W_06130 [Clostridia bacterium]
MTEKEIDLIASRNEEIPEFLALPEQLLFSLYRNLYAAYRRGDLTDEQMEREKRILHTEYLKAKSHYDRWVDGCRLHQERIRKSESALSDMVKCAGKVSEHELLLKALHCISLLAGEDVTEATVIKNMENPVSNDSSISPD